MTKREEAARAILAKVPEGYGMREDEALEYVDAVIACIREPDEKMLYDCSNIANPEYGRIITTQKNLRAIWQAMLDAMGG